MRIAALAAALLALPGGAFAQATHQHDAPATSTAAPAPAPAAGHEGHSEPAANAAGGHEGQQAPAGEHGAHAGGHAMPVTGAFGFYPYPRDASGTAWQPDASSHEGRHWTSGEWSLMAHAVFTGVWSSQGGRRGDDKAFLAGMAMLGARRELGERNVLNLRAMVSPDPLMGRRGYPLLLASGETADGARALVDRQHPHDLFMELSASLSHRFEGGASVFLYGGLPGEPAFGPPAFMHRASILDSPEAPISHHWLDSTHITFGVLTAGVTSGPWKIEASRFHGREPDQHRYDIETGALDSTAVRLSWNPTANWSLQASWADVTSPEQLEPDDDQTKWSASAIYTVPFGAAGKWSTTAAWGRRSSGHESLDALVLETSVKPNAAWTIFARAERTENNELLTVGGHHGPVYTVAKASFGAVRDWKVAEHASFGLGGLYAFNLVPKGLEGAYGGDPGGGMVFVRLKLQ